MALRPQDHPAIQALATGRPVRDAVVGVHRPGRDRAGEHIWLRVDSVPFNVVDGVARIVLVRMRHRDGRYLWMEVAGQLVRDRDGAPAQLRTSWRDVTARVKAERDRDSALDLVQSVVAHSPIGIAVSDGTGVLEQVNEALCTMLGREAGQLLGHRVDEFVDPDDGCPDGSAPLLTGALTAHESECRYLRQDGSSMWGHRTTMVLRDGENDAGARLLIHLQDVTARMGGDEFVVLCLHLPDHETAVRIAERIVEALSDPFEVGAVAITISASVGVTTGRGEDRRHLMTSADRAMYRAKQAGRGVVTHLRSDHRSSPA